MLSISEDFDMILSEWLDENVCSTKEILVDSMIDSYQQEDDLNEWENDMLEYLYTIC